MNYKIGGERGACDADIVAAARGLEDRAEGLLAHAQKLRAGVSPAVSNAITAAPLGRASIVLAHIDHVERFAYERPGVGLDASLTRILRVAAKVGVPVRVEIKPGRIIVATGAGGMPAGANSVDEMFA